MAESAVSFFALDRRDIAVKAAAQIKSIIVQKSDELAAGIAQDWADYKYRVGMIHGLKDAYDIITETEKEFSK